MGGKGLKRKEGGEKDKRSREGRELRKYLVDIIINEILKTFCLRLGIRG